MALHDAYVQGFCKVANDVGVDPDALVKCAKDSDFLSSIVEAYKSLDPQMKRVLLTSLITGLGTYAFSDGSQGNRILKGLAGASAGGLSMYGLNQSGLYDKGMKYVNDLIG